MKKLEQRVAILEESKDRMKALTKGAHVSNICAGDLGRHLIFIDYVIKSKKNRYGITQKAHLAKCRTSSGETRVFDINIIHSGKLSGEKCSELFEPVWQAQYGK